MSTRSILSHVNFEKKDQIRSFVSALEKAESYESLPAQISRQVNKPRGKDLLPFLQAFHHKDAQ